MAKGFGKKPPDDQTWNLAKQSAILSDGEIFTGIAQHPVTKRWQSWVSLYGADITCFTAHNKREDADKVAQDIAETWKKGQLETTEEVTAYLKSLPTDDVAAPLPQKIVERLSQQIKEKST